MRQGIGKDWVKMKFSFAILQTVVSSIILTVPAYAEVAMGEKTSDYATVQVEENIANPEVPTHFIVFNPLEGSSSAGALILRCKNNKTEAYYGAAQFEFFGMGSSPDISARFASENKSKKLSASGSSGMGDAAFINNPIGFIVNFAKEKEVVLSGSYYSGSFTALFKADDMVIDAIYDMANTCQWVEKLPTREDIVPASEASPSSSDGDVAALNSELKILVSKYGLLKVKEAVNLISD